MGGTFIRLVDHGHDVHVAYETSGDFAVNDDVVLQQLDTVRELGFADRFDEVKRLIAGKVKGQPEPRELLDIKAAIRRAEAKAADAPRLHDSFFAFGNTVELKDNVCQSRHVTRGDAAKALAESAFTVTQRFLSLIHI